MVSDGWYDYICEIRRKEASIFHNYIEANLQSASDQVDVPAGNRTPYMETGTRKQRLKSYRPRLRIITMMKEEEGNPSLEMSLVDPTLDSRQLLKLNELKT